MPIPAAPTANGVLKDLRLDLLYVAEVQCLRRWVDRQGIIRPGIFLIPHEVVNTTKPAAVRRDAEIGLLFAARELGDENLLLIGQDSTTA